MYFGLGNLFSKATYDRPYVVFVCDDALVIAQPPLDQPTMSFNRAAHQKAMKFVAQNMQQALQSPSLNDVSGEVVATMLRTFADKKGAPLNVEIVPTVDIVAARLAKSGLLGATITFTRKSGSSFDFGGMKKVVRAFADIVAKSLGGRLTR